jgi:tetratricopeptide (TPR) repeat protein
MSAQQALQLAAAHQQAGRLTQAEGILRQVLQQRPNDTNALHQLALLAYQAGKLPLAIELIARALSVDPNVQLFQANIAEMYRQAGHPKKAIEHGLKAVALKPDAAEAHNNLGIAYFDIGDYETAISSYDKALAARPRFAEAISNRANALRQLDRHSEAEGEYRRALTLNPGYAEGYNNLGSVLRDLDRPAEAEVAYRRALALKPDYGEAQNNLILALKDLKQLDAAQALAQQLLKANPKNADALAYLGAVFVEQKKPELALDALRSALALNPSKAEAVNMYGRALFEAGRATEAIEAYRRAIALKPDFADPYNNLGTALKEVGKFEDALKAFDTCLTLKPDTVGAYVNLVDAKKFRVRDDRHLAAIEGFLAQSERLSEEKQMLVNFAAAKAYDDLKRYDEAFACFQRGNALKRKTVSYDETAVLAFFDRIRAAFSADVVRSKAGSGFASARPIFVMGMPRSGTTLVEQILASHPCVAAAGELKELNDTVSSVRVADGSPLAFPEFAPTASGEGLSAIGRSYVERLERHAPQAERITDKMPSNFYFVGLIHLALPGAKIVHLNRNPVDTCLSCFSKLFAGEQNQTYELGELGRYYRAYHGLMAHWRAVLPPGAFLDVQYEDVVADIEGQARRIADYCGLDWDERMLDFHRTERPVKTASAAQVREPLYSRSVARWRNYEAHLGPLLDALGDLAR